MRKTIISVLVLVGLVTVMILLLYILKAQQPETTESPAGLLNRLSSASSIGR